MALEVKKRYPVPHTKSRSVHKLPQRTFKREQRRKSARRIVTSVLVLAMVAVGAGAAYTWYVGQSQSALANQPAPKAKARNIIKPPKIPSDARIGASIQTVTPEVKPGENASVSIRTNPEANCTISVKYNKVAAVDSGLAPKAADEFGTLSWAWTVAASAPAGKWPVEITCKNMKYSAFVATDVVVKP